MDLIELDAASNRGIDEIRNIRDRVNLAAVEGGYKVYIIDEAHMLTEHASNAFLKTLEEPPPHAIFILCTTEPHKILPTIISRCQRFDFRRLTSDTIVERLRIICLGEGVDAEGGVLTALARSAGGSLRDAENLLEQLVVSYGGRIGIKEVYELLGLGQGERALEFVRYLLIGKASAALAAINRAAWDGVDIRQLHRQAVDLLRGVLMLQCGSRESVGMPLETVKELEELAPKIPMDRVMKSLRAVGEVNMSYDVSSPLPLELAVVEVCMEDTPEAEITSRVGTPQPTGPGRSSGQIRPGPSLRPSPSSHPEAQRTTPTPLRPSERDNPTTGRPSPGGSTAAGEGSRVAASPRAGVSQPPAPAPQPSRTVGPPDSRAAARPQQQGASTPTGAKPTDEPLPQSRPEPEGPPGPQGAGGPFQERWGALVKNLSRYKGKRYNIGALLRDCKSQQVEGETLVLAFAHRSHLERMQEELDDPQGMRTVNEALLKLFGASYQLRLTLVGDNGAAAPSATAHSPLVRTALGIGARIMEEREQ